MGTAGMIQLPQIAAQRQDKIDAREAAHAQQMEVLRQRSEDARATMAERLQAQREMQANQLAFQKENAEANRANQASMARLAASLRAPTQAQIIQTDSGPMQLVGGKAVPIVGADGKQVKAGGAGGAKPLTESQGNATAFALRAGQALKELEGIKSTDGKTPYSPGVGDRVLAKVPFGAGNFALDTKSQQFMNAEKNYIAAVLRKESGAAISQGEYDTYGPMFFDRPGDSAEVKSQKARSRALAEETLKVQAGPQYSQHEKQALSAAGVNQPQVAKDTPATGGYADSAKEARYQAWKASQGAK